MMPSYDSKQESLLHMFPPGISKQRRQSYTARRNGIIGMCLLLFFSALFVTALLVSVFSSHIESDTESDLNSETMPLNITETPPQETIFVAIASYRDPRCVATILELFEKATYPDRLRVGIFQQHDQTDVDCLAIHQHVNCEDDSKDKHPICTRLWQIKIDRVKFQDAKGPVYGRYRTELFYNNEDFLMQIDAHHRMVPKWDEVVIDMFYRVGNDKAVLTTYPKAAQVVGEWEPPAANPSDSVVVIGSTDIIHNMMFKNSRASAVANPGKPVLTPFFAAGFSFQRGQRIIDVPSDPYFPFLFDGEETNMAARLWTSGYDLYVPDRDVTYHIYESILKQKTGEERHLFWNELPKTEMNKFKKYAERRALYVLGLLHKLSPGTVEYQVDMRDIEKYSLGHERNIEDFWNWIEMDWDKLKAGNLLNKIIEQKVQRIPTKTELLQA